MRACYKAGRKDCLKGYDTNYAASRDIKPTWGSWAILAFVPMVAAWLVSLGNPRAIPLDEGQIQRVKLRKWIEAP